MKQKQVVIAIAVMMSLAPAGCKEKKNTNGKAEIELHRAKAAPVIKQLRAFGKNLASAGPKADAKTLAGLKPSCNVLNIANVKKFNDLFLYKADFADLKKEAEVDQRIFGDETIRKAIGILEENVLIGGTARNPITAEMKDYDVDAIRYNLTGVGAFKFVFVVERTLYQPAIKTSSNEYKPGKTGLKAVLYDLATGKALDTIAAAGQSSKGVTTRQYQAGSDRIDEDLRERTREALEAACKARYGLK